MSTLAEFSVVPDLFRQVVIAMLVVAAMSLLHGWIAPTPWILAAALLVALMLFWFLAVSRFLQVQKAMP